MHTLHGHSHMRLALELLLLLLLLYCWPIFIAYAIVIENSIMIKLAFKPRSLNIFFKTNQSNHRIDHTEPMHTKTDIFEVCRHALAVHWNRKRSEQKKKSKTTNSCIHRGKIKLKIKSFFFSNWFVAIFYLHWQPNSVNVCVLGAN